MDAGMRARLATKTHRRQRLCVAFIASFVVVGVGCKTPSMLADSQRRPSGGVAQKDRSRWSDFLRPRPRLDKVDVPVWELPDRETDVAAIQLAYGRWMEKSGALEQAASAYQKALDEKPELVEAISGLARIDAVRGRVSEARKGFERAVTMAPSDAEVLESYGKFQLDQGQVDEAAELLLKSVEIMPTATSARYQLAIARARQGRIAEARTLFVATVGEAEAHHNIGMLLKDSRPATAAKEFRLALSKKPALQQAQVELAQLERAFGTEEILPASHSSAEPAGRTVISDLN